MIIAAVAVPLVVIAFVVMRRSRASGEELAGEDEETRERNEEEFAEAEAYQEEWRKENEPRRDPLG